VIVTRQGLVLYEQSAVSPYMFDIEC